MNNHKDANATDGKSQDDKMESRVKFVRSINSGNIFLIGHTDSKTAVIVTLNGIFLGLL